jgi:hypothetical protein
VLSGTFGRICRQRFKSKAKEGNRMMASEDLRDAHAKISTDRDAGIAFLKNQGFKDLEFVLLKRFGL